MDILFVLIPLSMVLLLVVIGVFAWALHGGQFDDLEREGQRILDADQSGSAASKPQLPQGQPRSQDMKKEPIDA